MTILQSASNLSHGISRERIPQEQLGRYLKGSKQNKHRYRVASVKNHISKEVLIELFYSCDHCVCNTSLKYLQFFIIVVGRKQKRCVTER